MRGMEEMTAEEGREVVRVIMRDVEKLKPHPTNVVYRYPIALKRDKVICDECRKKNNGKKLHCSQCWTFAAAQGVTQ